MDTGTASSVGELLRYMLIIDQAKLAAVETEFAGAIKLGLVGRYGCRLLVKGVMVEFTLAQLPDKTENFLVTENGLPIKAETSPTKQRLFSLVRHRAAEAMLAVRAGHFEYNKRRAKTS